MKLFNEIKAELNSVLKGKTIDALLPPLVFVIANMLSDLLTSSLIAILLAMSILVRRLLSGHYFWYSVFGFLGVMFAALFAYLMGNVGDYFLPGIIGSVFLAFISVISVLIKRPLPMLLSHLSRGWRFSWFLRKDIYPAYFEAGILWSAYFTLRAGFQVVFYANDNVGALTLMSTVFGFPLTVGILVVTYIYGMYRLKKLGGPGIDEFEAGKKPPYKGQTRGF